MEQIKVLLVDDHTLFRAGVKMLLQMETDIVITGETGEARTTMELTEKLQPDVVVLDISMPGYDGLAVAQDLAERTPQVKILVVSQHENREYVLRATKLGVSGYLVKSAAADELVNAIRTVARGGKYLDASVAKILMDAWQGAEKDEVQLSERESQVLTLTAEGKSMREISELLHISVKTVDYHRSRISEKLGIRGMVEFTRYAINHGLVKA